MAVVLTFVARVRDWQRLQAVSRATLVARAREVGAIRYETYRNATNAAEVLIVAEFRDHDAASEMRQILYDQLASLLNGRPPDDRLWEGCGWETLKPAKA